MLFKENRMGFIQKVWKNRRQLTTFGNGGVSILSSINKGESSNVITSLSGTCVLYEVDSMGFVHGYLKFVGSSSTAQRFNLEGNFTADAGKKCLEFNVALSSRNTKETKESQTLHFLAVDILWSNGSKSTLNTDTCIHHNLLVEKLSGHRHLR